MNSELVSFLCLAAASVAYVNAATGLERVRLAVSQRQVSTMLGVFTFAGVVVLPAQLFGLLVCVIYAVAWPTYRRAGARAHRHTYSAGAVIVAGIAAANVLHRLPYIPGLLAALVLYTAVNGGMIAAAITLAGHRNAWAMFRSRQFYAALGATLPAGAVTGVAMHLLHPLVVLAAIPATAGVHMWTASRTAEATGAVVDRVWARDAWLVLADEAERVGDIYTVLMVDLLDKADLVAARDVVLDWFGRTHAIGRYSETQLVVLLLNQVEASSRALGVRLSLLLTSRGIAAGVGVAENQDAALRDVLLIAETGAILSGATDQAESSDLH